MKHRYSLAYLTVPGTGPAEQIRIARETGYDFVSLRTIPMQLPGEPAFLPERDAALFAEVKAALQYWDMKLSDIELVRIRPELDLSGIRAAFEKAAELGASDVLCSVWTRDRAFYTEKTAETARLAAENGLRLNVEFLPWAGVRNLQETLTLIEELRSRGIDNVFVMIDTLHAGRAGVTKEEIRRAGPGCFGFMHICDGPAGESGDPVLDCITDPLMLRTAREERLYPGEGVMDIRGMVEAAKAEILSIELPHLERMKRYGAGGHARRCLEAAKALLEN